MNPRIRTVLLVGACFVIGAAAGVGGFKWWLSKSSPEAEKSESDYAEGNPDKAPEPTALVRTADVVQSTVHRTIEAMGIAVIPSTATVVVAWPADTVVARITVQPGQTVEKNAPLAQITLTRDAETQIVLAEQAVVATTRTLDIAKQRLDRGLATRPEMVTAQSANDEARQRFERLQKGLPPADGILHAPVAGVIGAIRAQVGATVTAGAAIVEITTPGTIVAQLAVELPDAHNLAIGQHFELRPLDERDTIKYQGELAIIGPAVNPVSKTLDVTIALSGPELPRPGAPLRGSAALSEQQAILIPRTALIPDGDEMVVFIVHDGKVKRTPVTVVFSFKDRVALSTGCSVGDQVVVMGQGQLTDGASVREEHESKSDQQKDASGANR